MRLGAIRLSLAANTHTHTNFKFHQLRHLRNRCCCCCCLDVVSLGDQSPAHSSALTPIKSDPKKPKRSEINTNPTCCHESGADICVHTSTHHPSPAAKHIQKRYCTRARVLFKCSAERTIAMRTALRRTHQKHIDELPNEAHLGSASAPLTA